MAGKLTKEQAQALQKRGVEARLARKNGTGPAEKTPRTPVGFRDKILRAMMWVATSPPDRKPKGPLQARLQKLEAEEPLPFMRELIKMLPQAKEPQVKEEQETERKVLGGSLDELRKWWAEEERENGT